MRTVPSTLARFGAACGVIAVMLAASGCIFVADGQQRTLTPTTGKQLCDLKSARDTGAINDDEYRQTKAKLLSDCK